MGCPDTNENAIHQLCDVIGSSVSRVSYASSDPPQVRAGLCRSFCLHMRPFAGAERPFGTVRRLWMIVSKSRQIETYGEVAIPTTGELSGTPPMEPSNSASPKAKMPPSDATIR